MYDNCVGHRVVKQRNYLHPSPHPGQADLTIKIAAHLLKNPGMGRAEAAAFFQGNDVI